MAYVNSTRAASLGLTDRIAGFAKTLRTAFDRRATYNRTVRELSALSTRELDDLGIHRSMISRIANEAAYGK